MLTIALATTITFTSESGRHSQSSNAGQKAYALAEAGINNAVAQLSPHYVNNTTGTPTDGSWNPGPPGGVPVSTSSGTVNWSGSFNSGAGTWSLTGTGAVVNPAAPGHSIARTATATTRQSRARR